MSLVQQRATVVICERAILVCFSHPYNAARDGCLMLYHINGNGSSGFTAEPAKDRMKVMDFNEL